MRRATILEGEPFDWDAGAKAMVNAVDENGEINWRCAWNADPGVTKCPECNEYYWAEGRKLKCLDCGAEFPTYKEPSK